MILTPPDAPDSGPTSAAGRPADPFEAAGGCAPAGVLRLSLPGPDDTARLGEALAAALAPGDAVLLEGELGAGKSALARAAIAAMLAEDGREEDIPSPSFTLVQIYDAARSEVWHADLHRLSGPAAIPELGLDDAFETAVVFVEWPDRLGPHAPARRLRLRLDFAGDDESDGRVVGVAGEGGGWERALAVLAAAAEPA